jgi:hypothetical protein
MKLPFVKLAVFFLALLVFFYIVPLQVNLDERIFITIATFFFAIFSGFFISRQGSRYSSIRDKTTAFDGNMSFLYRTFGHFGSEVQSEVENVMRDFYKEKDASAGKSWNYPFMNKSNTITSLHAIIEKSTAGKSLPTLQNAALTRMLASLHDLQVDRKNIISLCQEHIPKSQWILLYFLSGILFLSLAVVDSHLAVFVSLLKAAFGTSVVLALITLRKLDQLQFFEGTIGENSAQDAVDIFDDKK